MKKMLAFLKDHGTTIVGIIWVLLLCASFFIPLLVVIARLMWYAALM